MTTVGQLASKVDMLAQEVEQLRSFVQPQKLYKLSAHEKAAVKRGLQEVADGKVATQVEVEAVYKKHGLLG